MKVYLDNDFKCHASNQNGTLREFDAPFFDGKCPLFIEGYRYIPKGESWTRNDGKTFDVEMATPWKDLMELEAAQTQYEADLAAAAAAYQEGVDSV